ncbi:uncharacterized protein BO96DRAFT_331162 [Aspergillus niger CBS 101883]|uniref:uncharacterized protein n=1 Tax=Aspergillus lacticoffeatus (strain CBS 101883) TaxID=1450533 RepID=UPI000D7F5036|nr:uncharacterized protein BO96DRAFT_331162 [Aspergillus niger CBS 101883]PYH59273.1 hypothetical protein BO96DRAFT_331162 [Aspergillus niger CBS 101883]
MQQGKAVIIDWGGTEERGRETKQPRGSCGVGSAKGAKNEVLTETEERNDSFQVKRGQDGHGLGRPKMLLLCCARKEGIDGKKMGGSEELKQPAMGKEEEEACSTELLGVILTGEAIEEECDPSVHTVCVPHPFVVLLVRIGCAPLLPTITTWSGSPRLTTTYCYETSTDYALVHGGYHDSKYHYSFARFHHRPQVAPVNSTRPKKLAAPEGHRQRSAPQRGFPRLSLAVRESLLLGGYRRDDADLNESGQTILFFFWCRGPGDYLPLLPYTPLPGHDSSGHAVKENRTSHGTHFALKCEEEGGVNEEQGPPIVAGNWARSLTTDIASLFGSYSCTYPRSFPGSRGLYLPLVHPSRGEKEGHGG